MSPQLFMENTPIAIVLALIIAGLLAWRISPSRLSSLPWQSIGIACGLFWGILAAVLISIAWDYYYSEFVPSWYRIAAPIGAVLLYSTLGLLIRKAAVYLPGHPVIWFCVLGGLESVPEHAIAIFRFQILDISILQGSSAIAIFIFAFFEYVVFWGIALILSLGVDRALQTLSRKINLAFYTKTYEETQEELNGSHFR